MKHTQGGKDGVSRIAGAVLAGLMSVAANGATAAENTANVNKDTGREIAGNPAAAQAALVISLDGDGWLLATDPKNTGREQQWWLKHIGAEKQFSIGGNPIWAFNTALRILWMRKHEPEILAQTDKWLLIEDCINFMLCGEKATDYSMASSTLLFDQTQIGRAHV